MKIMSIRDIASNVYMGVWCAPTLGAATRYFADETNNQQSVIFNHPNDYELYEIGEFDNETGIVIPTQPRSIARASDYSEKEIERETKQTSLSKQTPQR